MCVCGAVKEQLQRQCPQCSLQLIFISEEAVAFHVLINVFLGGGMHCMQECIDKTHIDTSHTATNYKTHTFRVGDVSV